MKFLNRFNKPSKISSQEAIDILKEFEYILTDEGCTVNYLMLNDVGISSPSNDFRLDIHTPSYIKREVERSPLRYDNKTIYKYVQKFKQEEYFQEYIDRIFDAIPKTDFNILVTVDGLNLVYNIGRGILADGEALLTKKGKIELKSKK
jgi:hypothetical protein